MDKNWMLVLALFLAVGCDMERPVEPLEPIEPGTPGYLPPAEPVDPEYVPPADGTPEYVPPARGTDDVNPDAGYGTNGARGTDDVNPDAGYGTNGARPDAGYGTNGTRPDTLGTRPDTPVVPPATGTETPGTAQTMPGTAQPMPGTAQPGTGQGAEVDARAAASQALADVHQVHIHQLALARLVNEKSQDAAIREYAEREIREHTNADAELVQLASNEGIALEGADQNRYQDQLDTIERLRDLDGIQFEQAYVQEIIQSHDRALNLVQTGITTIQDPEVKSHFEKIQPVLKDHSDRAKALRPGEQGA